MGLRRDSASITFDHVGGDFDSTGFVRVIARRLINHCGVVSGSRVLDVACGTGAALLWALPEVGTDGFAVGVDLSYTMAGEARRQLGDEPRGAIAVMDAERLGFRAGSFDVACCASAIYMFENQRAVVREISRLLREGGRLGVSDFDAPDSRWEWYDALLNDLSPDFAELGGGHLGRSGLIELLTAECGPTRVQGERLDVAYENFESWWKAQWTYRGRQYLERMSSAAVETYRREARLAIRASQEDDGRLHWRPEVIYCVSVRRGHGAGGPAPWPVRSRKRPRRPERPAAGERTNR